MSARVAAGWARSRSQSVSVVPMIQCVPHGMTKSTDFSVRRMRPLSEVIRSRATTMCTPLLARTWKRPRPPAIVWMSSVQTPVQLITTDAVTVVRSPVSTSSTTAPTTRSPALTSSTTRRRADDGGAVGRRRADRGQGVPGVVGLRVVVEEGAGEGVRAQGRGHLERAGAGQLLVPRHRPGAAHRVVEGEARRDVGPLPAAPRQRVEEGDRPDEVRRDPAEHQLALLERLPDEVEVHLLEVAQAAVEELGGARGGPRPEVALLDEGGGQTTGRGIERDPGPGHPAADDEHVEVLGAEAAPRRRAVGLVETDRTRHRFPSGRLLGRQRRTAPFHSI